MSQHAALVRARPTAAPVEAMAPPTAAPTPQPVQRIAPLLALVTREFELDAAAAQVRVDAAPFRRRPAAVAAASQGRQIWLHPRLFDSAGQPRSPVHQLLAHEFVHLVQQRRPVAARAGTAAAELEAQQIARRVAEGRRAPRDLLVVGSLGTESLTAGPEQTPRRARTPDAARREQPRGIVVCERRPTHDSR
jgi:hypothetical protein